VLERLKALGQTISKNIVAQDVTDEYVDLGLQLKNAEALCDRLLSILEKATTVKDAVEVERELSRVRQEIERIKGRLAHLDKLIAYSTIDVSFTQAQQQQARIRRPESPFPWLDEIGVERVLGIRG
jgi:nitrate reductase assembly molybdenum cofactor insertion protein NarJ